MEMEVDGDGERQVTERWGRGEDRGMKGGGGGGGGIYQPATLKVVMTLIAAAFVRAGDRPPRRSYSLSHSLSRSLSRNQIRSHLPACTQASIHSGTCKQKT